MKASLSFIFVHQENVSSVDDMRERRKAADRTTVRHERVTADCGRYASGLRLALARLKRRMPLDVTECTAAMPA
jgi:hypothetical protein